MPEILVEPDDVAAQLRDYVREHPEVRHEDYRDCENPVRESCYALSEAYFHAQGGQDSDLEVYRLGWDDVDDDLTGSHWFLRRTTDDAIVDLSLPTPEAGNDVPWDMAKHRAFITGYTPSNRSQRVLDAVGLD